MAEDFNNLSQEQIKKLADVISGAKSLTSQQADIIERVLKGETDIGKLRIASLKEYFDIYSRNLDMIARKHSALNDAFLILNEQLMESYKKATNNDSKTKAEAASKKANSAKKQQDSNSQAEPTNNSSNNPPPPNNKPPAGGGNTNPAGGGTPPTSGGVSVFNRTSSEKRNAMDTFTEDDFQRTVDKLAKFFQESEKTRRDIIEDQSAYLEAIEVRRQEQRIDKLRKHAKQVETIEEAIMDLELLRHQSEQDRQEQVSELRLSRLNNAIVSEAKAQELINNIAAELAYANGLSFIPATESSSSEQQQNEATSNAKTASNIVYSNNTVMNNGQAASAATPINTYNTSTISDIKNFEMHNVGNNGQEITEAGNTYARIAEAQEKLKSAKAFEDSIAKYRARKHLEAMRKNNGILSKEEASRIEKEIAKKFTLEKLNDKKRVEARTKLEIEQARKKERDELKKDIKSLTGEGKTIKERKEALHNLTHNETGEFDRGKAISAAIIAVSDAAKQLEKKIDDIASFKGTIDTRLQGSSNEQYAGSYWDQLVRDMTSVGAINPFFKQETFANNMKDLVNRGIAFDLKQRAFLMTIQEKIANTFDVADGTLLRLIRIQQEDSTAGRLGMESALNTFLNSMYETSEYLTQVADSVRGSLEEMQALMQGAEATEVEYQVQKWLGSLYSVGMSQNAVNSISTALGQIAAGQIEGLTGGGAGNLLVMAANDAGLSIADILTNGINAEDTNKLLQAAVDYLAELSDSAKDNKVVQQQLANVFGVKASDLRAATNLVTPGTTQTIYGSNLQYDDMLSQLVTMASSMGSRTSMAELMTNFWENGQYTLAGSMASNPVSYFIYKMATVLDSAAGGVDIPFINVFGSGVDLNTTVADLMRVGAIGTGILGSIGPLISGLGSSFDAVSMLNKLGVKSGSGLAVTPRGTSISLSSTAGSSTSESGYVGNASGSDIKNSTLQEAADNKKQLMIEAQEEAEANGIDALNTTVLKIYELLDDVANGDKCLRVKVDTYGLTKMNSTGTGSLGGINAIAGTSGGVSTGGSSGNSLGGNAGSSSGSAGVNSSSVSGGVDLGGWTIL